MRRFLAAPGAVLAIGVLAIAQDTRPQFEVASIRPSEPDAPQRGFSVADGQLSARRVTVRMLIERAYHLQPSQLEGLPGWAESDRYDVRAVAPGVSSTDQARPMMQRLLEERFGLRTRVERKEQNVYALQTRGEVKLKPTGTPGRPLLRITIGNEENRNVRNEFQATTMARFADELARETGRVVVDETGLTGEFDFVLQSEREPEERNRFVSPIAPLVGTLGLRLEGRKAMVEVYVVEGVERPGEN